MFVRLLKYKLVVVVFAQLAPELFLSSPDLLMQLVTMVSPETLAKKGVPVTTALQVRAHVRTAGYCMG